MPNIRFTLTDFQMRVVEQLVNSSGAPSSLDGLVAVAVEFDASREAEPRWERHRPSARRTTARRPDARLDTLIAPASGAAIPLARGDTLRLEQVGDGQGIDVCVYELEGHERRLSAARTRAMHGIHPTVGATLWSTPPEVPLMTFVADTAPSHDLCFPPCTAFEYEQLTGIADHASCSAIHAELVAKSKLPVAGGDDVLNLWLPTAVDDTGMLRWWPVSCRRGDRVDLRAERGVLVTVSTCPDDLFGSSQYDPSPVRVIVRGAGAGSSIEKPHVVEAHRHDRRHEVEIELMPDSIGHLESALSRGWLGYGLGAVARALLFRWYEALGGHRHFEAAVSSADSSHIASKGQRSSHSAPTASSR